MFWYFLILTFLSIYAGDNDDEHLSTRDKKRIEMAKELIQAEKIKLRKLIKESKKLEKEQLKAQNKKEILYCRQYLKNGGYGQKEAQLNLLKYLCQLQEIDQDDLIHLEYIFKANYQIDELDRTVLNLSDTIDCCSLIFDSGNPNNSCKILEKIIKFVPKFSKYKKTIKNRDELLAQVSEFILKVAVHQDQFNKDVVNKLGTNLKFVKEVYEKVLNISEETAIHYFNIQEVDVAKMVIKSTQDLEVSFKNKIKKLMFRKENRSKNNAQESIDPVLENNNINNIIVYYEQIKDKTE